MLQSSSDFHLGLLQLNSNTFINVFNILTSCISKQVFTVCCWERTRQVKFVMFLKSHRRKFWQGFSRTRAQNQSTCKLFLLPKYKITKLDKNWHNPATDYWKSRNLIGYTGTYYWSNRSFCSARYIVVITEVKSYSRNLLIYFIDIPLINRSVTGLCSNNIIRWLALGFYWLW